MRPRRASPSWFLADHEKSGAFGTGSWTDTSPQNGCCRATFGCRIGTIKKSATYEISFVTEHRAALSVNLLKIKEQRKTRRLKEKMPASFPARITLGYSVTLSPDWPQKRRT